MSAPDLPEFNKSADGLIEALKQYFERIEGYTPNPTQLANEANKVIKRRLGK